jgi:hypothetical protein
MPKQEDNKWRWIYGTTPSSGNALVEVGAAVHNGKSTYHFKTTSGLIRGEGTKTADLSKWTHLIMVYNGSTIKGYVNTQLDFNRSQTGKVQSSQRQQLGYGFIASAKEFFKGGVDDLRIYNRALTSTEINTLYREGKW